MHGIELHERAIINRLANGSDKAKGLFNMQNVTVHFLGDDLSKRDAIIPITIKGKPASVAVKEYIEKGIVVFERAANSVMSKRQLQAVGLEELIRISPMHFNTADEVDRFLTVTSEIAE
jgi:selenocysteine lyase/cysteine desulfurase